MGNSDSLFMATPYDDDGEDYHEEGGHLVPRQRLEQGEQRALLTSPTSQPVQWTAMGTGPYEKVPQKKMAKKKKKKRCAEAKHAVDMQPEPVRKDVSLEMSYNAQAGGRPELDAGHQAESRGRPELGAGHLTSGFGRPWQVWHCRLCNDMILHNPHWPCRCPEPVHAHCLDEFRTRSPQHYFECLGCHYVYQVVGMQNIAEMYLASHRAHMPSQHPAMKARRRLAKGCSGCWARTFGCLGDLWNTPYAMDRPWMSWIVVHCVTLALAFFMHVLDTEQVLLDSRWTNLFRTVHLGELYLTLATVILFVLFLVARSWLACMFPDDSGGCRSCMDMLLCRHSLPVFLLTGVALGVTVSPSIGFLTLSTWTSLSVHDQRISLLLRSRVKKFPLLEFTR